MKPRNVAKPPSLEFLEILRRPTELLHEEPSALGGSTDLFSVERLEQYAATLAADLRVSPRPRRGRSLRKPLRKDGRKLVQAYLALSQSIRGKVAVSPAAEWFVDNFHLIEEQLGEVRRNLPEDYYHGLPQLADGELRGYPRVYAISLALIAHSDSRLDADSLRRFLIAYQKVAPLQIGELWAISLTLRIALFEHLTPIALRLVSARESRLQADAFAEQLLAAAVRPEVTERDLIRRLNRELGTPRRFNRAVVVQLIQRLRDQDPEVWPAFDWIETQLNSLGTNAQSVTQLEHHRQAAAQVTIGNIIASTRLLSSLDWRELFESVSLVDRELERDPAGAYAQMNFGTRDIYRHALERIAKRSRRSEVDVARLAIEHSQAYPLGSRRHHVGYALVGDGRVALELAAGYRSPLRERARRFVRRHSAGFYLAAIALLSICFLVPVIAYLVMKGGTWLELIGFGLIALAPASELALSLVHHYVHHAVRPRPLPRMETKHGLPDDAVTMVVIPTLFTSTDAVHELVARLEIHALANPDPQLYFALLGDYADADSESRPGDDDIVAIAREGIDTLNARHVGEGPPRFHLFLRRRQWNASEGRWIGWERKRGKLEEFNRLLRGATDTSYAVATADAELLRQTQFVITLDSDTQLPRDAARKLVGTIIHPLNRPQYDSALERVTAGFGILQPRISVTSPKRAGHALRSRFFGQRRA